MPKEEAIILSASLAAIADDYPIMRDEILEVCDLLEGGFMTTETLRRLQQKDVIFREIFQDCFSRLGVVML